MGAFNLLRCTGKHQQYQSDESQPHPTKCTYWYDHYPQNRTSGNHTCGKRSGGNVGGIIITIIKYS